METKVREGQPKDIARHILGALGLRPFHVFDGHRYHVCFSVATDVLGELNLDKELLDDFFLNCSRSPSTLVAHKESTVVIEGPSLSPPTPRIADEENKGSMPTRENDCLSCVCSSPKEAYYIMEEHYLSTSPRKKENERRNESFRAVEVPQTEEKAHASRSHRVGENSYNEENRNLPVGHTGKHMHFVMENNLLSPEELRLSICFPFLLAHSSPSKGVRIDYCSLHGAASPLGNDISAADNSEASTRSNAGKVKEEKVFNPKKKSALPVEEYGGSRSVRLDKRSAKDPQRKRKVSQGSFTEREPPWSGLGVGDLVEQIGDSWVEDEKSRGLCEENSLDAVNTGLIKKSFWPLPLYGSPGCQMKARAGVPRTSNQSSKVAYSDEENSESGDFEEFLEQSKKREEVALLKYALLFKDDQSWRKKFLDGLNLTCDICFSKRKIKKFSSVVTLLAHAKTVTHLRQPEHRGYAEAISNLLRLDEPGNFPACNSTVGVPSCRIEAVWPPVVVLENTVIAVDLDGCFVGLSIDDLTHMLKGLGDRGKRKLHPLFGENGVTGQVLVEFPATHRGWIDARHMHHQFEIHSRSYEDWLKLKPKYRLLHCDSIEVQECNGLLSVMEDNESVRRILYGYLATPHIMKHIDPSKQYVDWKVQNLRNYFEMSDYFQE